MANNEEIKKANFELSGGWSDHVEEATIDKALNEARAEGYKQGYKDVAEQIFTDLQEIITLVPTIDEVDIKAILTESDKFKAVEKKYGVD